MTRFFQTLLTAVVAVSISGCDQQEPSAPMVIPELPAILPNQITVSGLGDGAFLASQLHLALNDRINGLGVVGGGLYYCAQGDAEKMQEPCRAGGRVDLPKLVHAARDFAAAGELPTLNHLDGDRIWALHGESDATFSVEITYAVVEFYEALGDAIATRFIEAVDSGHGMPTLTEGHQCNRTESPYLNECNYDAAGAMLQYLYGDEREAPGRGAGDIRQLTSIDGREAFAYVPPSCGHAHCRLHVVLHTCGQSSVEIGERFVNDAGYNRWADAFGLVILYPQAPSNEDKRCWDWGYRDDPHYATKLGADVTSVTQLIDLVVGIQPAQNP